MAKTGRTRIRTEINRKGKKMYIAEYEFKFLFKRDWHNVVGRHDFEDNWFKTKKEAEERLGKYKDRIYKTKEIELM